MNLPIGYSQVFFVAAFLLLGFLLLLLAKYFLDIKTNNIFYKYSKLIYNYYFPFSVLILVWMLIGVSPIFYGILFFITGLLFIPYIRDYIFGLGYKNRFELKAGGQFVSSNGIKGKLTNVGIFGLYLLSEEGNTFVRYSHIEDGSYSINDSKMPTLLNISLSSDSLIESTKKLENLLFNSPYIVSNIKPKVEHHPVENIIHLEAVIYNHYWKAALLKELGNQGFQIIKKRN